MKDIFGERAAMLSAERLLDPFGGVTATILRPFLLTVLL